MKTVKACVLKTAGTNCDQETVYAFRLAGALTDLVNVKKLYDGKKSLEEYHIMAIPGGFSYGDDISAAILWALELKYKIGRSVERFIDDGRLVIGICNGFQVLVKAGLLPAFDGRMNRAATLFFNDVGVYQDRWVYLRKEASICPFLNDVKERLYLPVAHAEGKFFIDKEGLNKLEKNGQIVFRYVNEEGKLAGFPWNPNGSTGNIAGICNPEGNVIGLMPHPERYLHKYMHPRWTCMKQLPEEGDGLAIFRGMVRYVRERMS